MRRFILLWALVAPLTGTVVAAQEQREVIDVSTLGPQVGEQIPDFRLADQNGTEWTRESILGPNGAFILFHRSADW